MSVVSPPLVTTKSHYQKECGVAWRDTLYTSSAYFEAVTGTFKFYAGDPDTGTLAETVTIGARKAM